MRGEVKGFMFDWLANRVEEWVRPADEESVALYASLVGLGRDSRLYLRYGVADSLDGRFDVLCLLVVLVVRRLEAMGDEGRATAQGVIDTMFADMDMVLREVGVGENKIGRKIKQMAEAYLGRFKVYSSALDQNDVKALEAAFLRNIYRGAKSQSAADLAQKVVALAEELDSLKDDEVVNKSAAVLEKINA